MSPSPIPDAVVSGLPRRGPVLIEIGGDQFTFGAAHAGLHADGLEPMHGHTYTAALRVNGYLDGSGMVTDFGPLKAALRAAITPLRRRILLAADSTGLPVEVCGARVRFGTGQQYYDLPAAAVLLLPITSTTTEALGTYLLQEATTDLDGSNLCWVELTLSEAPGVSATIRWDLTSVGQW